MKPFSLRKKVFTIPNFITLFRFGIIFLLFWVWFSEKLFSHEVVRIVVVIILYTLGALSDYVDGYWARQYKEKSKVGAFMDSLVDKFFTISFFVAYLYIDLVEIWWGWVFLIILREFWITGIRILFAIRNIVLVTEKHGKMKMAIQIVFQSIIWIYLLGYSITYETDSFKEYLITHDYMDKALLEIPFAIYKGFYQEIWGIPEFLLHIFWVMPNVLISGVVAFTIFSGINYILNNRYTRQA